ncbi:hypothetical protein, partial [Paramuribaculum intestinale]
PRVSGGGDLRRPGGQSVHPIRPSRGACEISRSRQPRPFSPPFLLSPLRRGVVVVDHRPL